VKQHLLSKGRFFCDLPTQHAYFACRLFPNSCAWCDESSESALLTEGDLGVGTEGDRTEGRHCDPICRECNDEGKPLPLWGSVRKFKSRASPVQGYSKTGEDKDERDELDELDELDDGRVNEDGEEGSESIESLMQAGYLQRWETATNSRCEKCNHGGSLVECSFCNCCWHLTSDRQCLLEAKQLLPETGKNLAIPDAEWACRVCFHEAKAKSNKKRKASTQKSSSSGGGGGSRSGSDSGSSSGSGSRSASWRSSGSGSGSGSGSAASLCTDCRSPFSDESCKGCMKQLCPTCDRGAFERGRKRRKGKANTKERWNYGRCASCAIYF
jgi:hypothetical protein